MELMAGKSMLRFSFLLFLVVTCHSQTCQRKTYPQRVCDDQSSFPSAQDFGTLATSLSGTTVTRGDSTYSTASLMYNRRFDERPYVIYYVQSVDDVQKIIAFARAKNLKVSVRSSGHSFVGRSTNNDGIIIDLRKLKKKQFNFSSTRNQAGELTVESGNTWLEVYKEVDSTVAPDKKLRVIVGGSAHTVAIGGYTLGGGHSPISRKYGLAVDNLLEATIVLADGSKAVVNAQGTTRTYTNGTTESSDDTSLFWAIRGGGGGTWGVVIDFTFKLHYAPQRFRNIVISWALFYRGYDIGSELFNFVVKQLAGLSNDWGGYLLLGTTPLDNDATGSLTLFLNHAGSDDSQSNSEVTALLNYNKLKNQYSKIDRSFGTFLGYEENAVDPAETNSYLFNSFIQPTIVQDETKLNNFVKFLMTLKDRNVDLAIYGCTFTLIGGKMNQVASDATPVNPKFRSGLFSASCGAGLTIGKPNGCFLKRAMQARDCLSDFGEGSYFNEPAEDLNDWKTQFWGTTANYERLRQAKLKWDPDHFFWCHNCVGSDEVSGGSSCGANSSDQCQCTSVPSCGPGTDIQCNCLSGAESSFALWARWKSTAASLVLCLALLGTRY